MAPMEPPFGAGSNRRDFMRNGFGSFALVCTFAAHGLAPRRGGDEVHRPRHVGRAPLQGRFAVHAVHA